MEMKVSQVGCFQITGRWICYSIFFDISFIVFFTRLLWKSLWRNFLFLFQLKFLKSMSRCSILQNISGFVILKLRPFECKVKSWKICPFLGLFFTEIKNVDILNFSSLKHFGHDFTFLKKWHIWVYYCWNYGPSNLKAELKADLWLQIGIYPRKNCPRHGSGQLPPANS